jgi:flavin reductase (DIM6/NTAB) family NADH-FMN oxidoreductase RutF
LAGRGEIAWETPAEAIDPARYRSVLGSFASGVAVITAQRGDQPAGLTCQSFFSVSLEPPLVAFAPARTSESYKEIREAGRFCVNVLAAEQEELCRRFAKSGPEKWRGATWEPSPGGSPIFPGVVAWIDCELVAACAAGDHHLVVGRVTAMRAYEREPLVYFRSAFHEVKAR